MRLLGLVIAIPVLAVIFALLERRYAAVKPKTIFRRERLIDFGFWFVTPLLTNTLTSVLIFAAVMLMPGRGSTWFTRQPAPLQLIETLVAADLLGYFGHRLFHRAGLLWRIHAVHHSSEDLDWLSATRLHPLNEAGMRLFQVVPLYLLGFRGGALASVAPLLTAWAVIIHANLNWDLGPLRYVIASPLFHRWHHTSEEEGLDRNFAGLFPWIDAMFGTLYMPRGRQPERFGLAAVVR